MESGQIRYDQITESDTCASLAGPRLFLSPVFTQKSSDKSLLNFLEVRLTEDYVITAIATQGGILGEKPLHGDGVQVYAEHFNMSYKRTQDHDDIWKTYLNLDGSEKVQLLYNVAQQECNLLSLWMLQSIRASKYHIIE